MANAISAWDPGGGVGADQLDLLAARPAEGVEEAAKRRLVVAGAAHTGRPVSWSTTAVR
jgi:hypothetical protein